MPLYDPDPDWDTVAEQEIESRRDAMIWGAWEGAGHYEKACDGWSDDPDGNIICSTCLEAVPVPEGAGV